MFRRWKTIYQKRKGVRGKRIDANQNEVVKSLRKIPGVSVAITSAMGKGYPDLNVGYKGITYLFELKDGNKTASQKKLTEDELQWHSKWTGHVAVVECVDDIIEIIMK
jgi:hypothetical protein